MKSASRLTPARLAAHLCAALLTFACVGQLEVAPAPAQAQGDGGDPDAGTPAGAGDSGSATPDAGVDAGTVAGPDGGPGPDLDAGPGVDGGSGPGPDAGLDPDAGPSADAGAGLDAGPADAGGGPDAGPTFTAISVPAAVAKVKTLLVGLPPTNDEVAQVVGDRAALRTLIDQWAQLPQYETKLRSFFSNAFQQSQVTAGDIDDQTAGFHDVTDGDGKLLQALRESFARTAIELIRLNRPFTETMGTTRFMMTPKLAALYAYTDTQLIDDNNTKTDTLLKANPAFQFVAQSTTSTPISDSLDPASPSYLNFYVPKLAPVSGGLPYDPACPTDVIVYNKALTNNLGQNLYQLITGHGLPQFKVTLAGNVSHQCSPPGITSVFSGTDYSQWRMVTIRPPNAGEATTRFWDLNTIRSGSELVLGVPRVGFFTTMAFVGEWQTNTSNQARVTINQTMIVALNKSIDLSNTTPPRSLASLDQAHAAPGTECYQCHQSLDPLRQLYRQVFSLHFHQQTSPAMTALPGQFAFHGVSVQGNTIFDLAKNLAGHPMFAAAWVQKLCTYATSAECLEDDPEFMRLVAAFKASNYSWPVLVRELFSSPLVTYLSETATASANGQVFPVARRAHLCMTLSSRLGLSDVCGLDVNTNAGAAGLGTVQTIARVLPSDQYSRGSEIPVLANDPSLVFRTGMENICAALANKLVDGGGGGKWVSTAPASVTTAIGDFVHALMGVNGDRDAPRISILTDHFTAAKAAQLAALPQTTPPAAPTPAQVAQAQSDALRSTFVLACLSPSVVGVGQ